MKCNLILSLFIILVGTSTYAADKEPNQHCDAVARNLVSNNNGCPNGSCRFDINDGKLVGLNGAAVNTNGDKTSMTTVSPASNGKPGVTQLELVKGKDGSRELTFTKITATGGATTTRYNLVAGEGLCDHTLTESKEKGASMFGVDYDPEFCSQAANAFIGMNATQAKTCDDSMKALVESFENRSNQLLKQGKTFHSSGVLAKVKSSTVSLADAGQTQLMLALQQRDRCVAATAEVNAAQPPNARRLGIEEITIPLNFISGESFRIIDKRAYDSNGKPIDFDPRGTKK